MSGVNLKNGFAMVASDVIRKNTLTPYELSIYTILVDYADRNGNAYPSYTQVAERAGCARNTAVNAIKSLVAKGYIHKEERKGTYHNNKTNCYTIITGSSSQKEENVKIAPPSAPNAPFQYTPFIKGMSVKQQRLIEIFENNLFNINNAIKKKLVALLESDSFEFLAAVIQYQAEINTNTWTGFEIGYKKFKEKGIKTVTALQQDIAAFREKCVAIKENKKKLKKEARVAKAAKKAEKAALISERKKHNESTKIADLEEKYGKEEVAAAKDYVAAAGSKVRNLFSYIKAVLENGWHKVARNKKKNNKKQLKFNNYSQVEYDPEVLEACLTGFDKAGNPCEIELCDAVVNRPQKNSDIDDNELLGFDDLEENEVDMTIVDGKVEDALKELRNPINGEKPAVSQELIDKYKNFMDVKNLSKADFDLLETFDINVLRKAVCRYLAKNRFNGLVGVKLNMNVVKEILV